MSRIAVLATVLLLTGCATAEEPSVPHGYVEGAEETAEAQLRLVLADDDGAVRVLDLTTEEVTELGPVDGVDAIRGDGRYAHLADGDTTHVVDSGGWMVDHGDHVHYYRTEPRLVPDGEEDPVEAPCPDAGAPRETRRGTVFACADGAVLVDDGKNTEFPYPATTAPPADDLTHRSRSTTLAGISAGHGVWVLDVTAKTWTLVPTGPVVAANTAGEGTPLLTLTADGVLHAHDIATGAEITTTPLLTAVTGTPVIEVEPARAYVNDPAARKVHEIDYNDDLRVARTFPLDIAPTHMVETGR